MTPRKIQVYDESREEWRSFDVPANDTRFIMRCANGLHQMLEKDRQCVCKKIQQHDIREAS